jgi:hypothetical protein
MNSSIKAAGIEATSLHCVAPSISKKSSIQIQFGMATWYLQRVEEESSGTKIEPGDPGKRASEARRQLWRVGCEAYWIIPLPSISFLTGLEEGKLD